MDDSLHHADESYEKDQPATYFLSDVSLHDLGFTVEYTDQLCYNLYTLDFLIKKRHSFFMEG